MILSLIFLQIQDPSNLATSITFPSLFESLSNEFSTIRLNHKS
uniref:Uncharacterized protein n=1 Tax=Arundo donax TaxID=35708 RepID=A0A0A8YAQ7_ARUDO